MNYKESIAFLDKCINYERIGYAHLTKERHLVDFELFLTRLRSPHRYFPVIHIAGTKGKGSTAHLLTCALEACGYRVGLYTSPHIDDYRERIRINMTPISRDAFADRLTNVVDAYPEDKNYDHSGFRTVFELLTAMAFLHFLFFRQHH